MKVPIPNLKYQCMNIPEFEVVLTTRDESALTLTYRCIFYLLVKAKFLHTNIFTKY